MRIPSSRPFDCIRSVENSKDCTLSATYVYRITLTLRVTKKEIVLLDIGSHDDVYR